MELRTLLTAVSFLLAVLIGTSECQASGFYLTIGIGSNYSKPIDVVDEDTGEKVSEFEWQDQGKAGCGLGLGYMHDFRNGLMLDLAYRHKSQCAAGAPVNSDPETSAEFLYLDLYWFPFK